MGRACEYSGAVHATRKAAAKWTCARTRAHMRALLLALCFLSTAPAVAHELDGGDWRFDPATEYRFIAGSMSNFALDPQNATHVDQPWLGEQRLRLSPGLEIGTTFRLKIEVDVGGPLPWQETSAVGTVNPGTQWEKIPRRGASAAAFDPRMIYIEWKSGLGLFRIGQMGNQWGLGMLANDGEGNALFGQKHFGDLVDRVMFATAPFLAMTQATWARQTFAGIAGDLVYRDETADLIAGDVAYQAVLFLLNRAEEGSEVDHALGIYAAYRAQQDSPAHDNARTSVWVLDAYGELKKMAMTKALSLDAAFEVAGIVGSTERLITPSAPAGVGIASLGAVARAGITYEPANTGLHLELGFASGDADSSESPHRTFTFNPDYHVGLILFDELLAAETAHAADVASDPRRSATIPRGLDGIVTDGAVTNALYLRPMLEYRVRQALKIRLAWLFAFAPAPVIDPYLTFANGGTPTGFRGGLALDNRTYGNEIDLLIERWFFLGDDHRIALIPALELALAFPGNVFNDGAGNSLPPIGLALFRLTARLLPAEGH